MIDHYRKFIDLTFSPALFVCLFFFWGISSYSHSQDKPKAKTPALDSELSANKLEKLSIDEDIIDEEYIRLKDLQRGNITIDKLKVKKLLIQEEPEKKGPDIDYSKTELFDIELNLEYNYLQNESTEKQASTDVGGNSTSTNISTTQVSPNSFGIDFKLWKVKYKKPWQVGLELFARPITQVDTISNGQTVLFDFPFEWFARVKVLKYKGWKGRSPQIALDYNRFTTIGSTTSGALGKREVVTVYATFSYIYYPKFFGLEHPFSAHFSYGISARGKLPTGSEEKFKGYKIEFDWKIYIITRFLYVKPIAGYERLKDTTTITRLKYGMGAGFTF